MEDLIGVECFSSIVMVVGSVVSAGPVGGSDKMLVLSVDIGEKVPRTILSGIAQHYTACDLVGKKCVVVSNLSPKEILGIVSNGMLVCVECADGFGGKCVRVIDPGLGVPVGSRLL